MGGDESLAASVFNASVVGLAAGGLVGAVSSAWRTQTPGVTSLHGTGVNSIRGQAALFALAGVAFTATEGLTASVLEDTGVVPTTFGGIAAGSVLGMAAKSVRFGAVSSLVIGGVMLFSAANGAKLSQQGPRNFEKMFNYKKE